MTHIQLTPSQQEALQQIIKFITIDEATVFMLNGAAGTGKTTLVKAIIEYLELQKRTFALMAPTGRAAYILCQRTGKPACTIHRGIYTLNNLEIKDDTNQSQAKYGLQINQDSVRTVYIVDEASMIADVQQESEAFVFGTGRLLHDLFTYTQCCPKRFSIKTKKGSKAKVEITTLAKSTTSFTSYGKYNTFRTSNR